MTEGAAPIGTPHYGQAAAVWAHTGAGAAAFAEILAHVTSVAEQSQPMAEVTHAAEAPGPASPARESSEHADTASVAKPPSVPPSPYASFASLPPQPAVANPAHLSPDALQGFEEALALTGRTGAPIAVEPAGPGISPGGPAFDQNGNPIPGAGMWLFQIGGGVPNPSGQWVEVGPDS